MKVLCLTRAYGQQAGGMERLSYELIHALGNIPGIEAQAITPAGQRPATSLFTARLKAVVFLFINIGRALLAARDVDVIHLGDPVLSIHGWLIKKVWHKPVAVTIHGLDISFSQPLYQLYLRLFFRNFDMYLPISIYAKNLLLNHHSLKAKVITITPGIHDYNYDPKISRDSLDKIVGRSTDNIFVLLTVGRLVKRKGHAWFIKNVLPSLPANTIYLIAGDGPEKDNLRQLMKATGQDKRVILLGRVSPDQLKVIYNTCDAYIQPNIPVVNDPEGFGLVLLEAALCNRHVVAAGLEGMASAVQPGLNGHLLPPLQPTAWITHITHLSQQSAPTSARSYTLEKFSWTGQANKYHQAFKKLLSPA